MEVKPRDHEVMTIFVFKMLCLLKQYTSDVLDRESTFMGGGVAASNSEGCGRTKMGCAGSDRLD